MCLIVAAPQLAATEAAPSSAPAAQRLAAPGKWMAHYYLNPEPDLIPAFIEQVGVQGGFKEQSGVLPVVAFVAEVMRQHPSQVSAWVAEVVAKDKGYEGHMLHALWLAGVPETKALLGELDANEHSGGFLDSPPPQLLEIEISSPDVINMLWATFMASGDGRYVQRIVSVLSPGDSAQQGEAQDDDFHGQMIRDAAAWSLRGNAYQHHRVYEICSEAMKSGDMATRLALANILSMVDRRREVEKSQ